MCLAKLVCDPVWLWIEYLWLSHGKAELSASVICPTGLENYIQT